MTNQTYSLDFQYPLILILINRQKNDANRPAKHISLGIIRDNTCRVSRLFRIFLSANAQYAGIALSWKWLIDDNLNLFLLLSTHS